MLTCNLYLPIWLCDYLLFAAFLWESKHPSSVRAALPNVTVQNGSDIRTAHFTAQTNLESAACRTKPVWFTRIQHINLYIEALQEGKQLRWLHA